MTLHQNRNTGLIRPAKVEPTGRELRDKAYASGLVASGQTVRTLSIQRGNAPELDRYNIYTPQQQRGLDVIEAKAAQEDVAYSKQERTTGLLRSKTDYLAPLLKEARLAATIKNVDAGTETVDQERYIGTLRSLGFGDIANKLSNDGAGSRQFDPRLWETAAERADQETEGKAGYFTFDTSDFGEEGRQKFKTRRTIEIYEQLGGRERQEGKTSPKTQEVSVTAGLQSGDLQAEPATAEQAPAPETPTGRYFGAMRTRGRAQAEESERQRREYQAQPDDVFLPMIREDVAKGMSVIDAVTRWTDKLGDGARASRLVREGSSQGNRYSTQAVNLDGMSRQEAKRRFNTLKVGEQFIVRDRKTGELATYEKLPNGKVNHVGSP